MKKWIRFIIAILLLFPIIIPAHLAVYFFIWLSVSDEEWNTPNSFDKNYCHNLFNWYLLK